MIICLGLTPAYQRTMIFDRLTLDAVNRACDVRHAASGKAVNAARVLRTLGREVLATGVLGGHTGRLMRADMDAAGIRHDFVEVEAATRICITLVDRAARAATELVEEASPIAAPACAVLLEKLEGWLGDAKVLILSGSLPPGVSDDFYRRCVQQARGRGVKVVLDARGKPLLEALGERPLVVKPNRRELAETFGVNPRDESAVAGAMQEVVGCGARWVVITAGADGVLVTDGRQFHRLAVPRITPVNPIGSGDAFVAGLAAGLADGQDVPGACSLAIACGVANALTDQAGFVDPARVAEWMSQIQVI